MTLVQALPLILTTFLCAYSAIRILEPFAYGVGLVDRPSQRKAHHGNIPLIGGISIFIAVLICSSVWVPNSREFQMFLISSAMIVFIGALDDKYDLSVRLRIVGQIIVSSMLIYGAGINISEFGNLFSLGNIDIGMFGVLFTYLAIMVLINAFNMIDGLDGLLGMLSLNTFISLSALFLLAGQQEDFIFSLIIIVAILPYLAFNLGIIKSKSNQIYMGDSGSMFIGLSIIVLLSNGTQGDKASFSPIIALWITAIPLMDMLAIIIRRLKHDNSPFKPDRDHLHHILIKYGFTQSQTLMAITSVSVMFSIIGVLGHLEQWSESSMLSTFLILFLIYNSIISKLSNLVSTK